MPLGSRNDHTSLRLSHIVRGHDLNAKFVERVLDLRVKIRKRFNSAFLIFQPRNQHVLDVKIRRCPLQFPVPTTFASSNDLNDKPTPNEKTLSLCHCRSSGSGRDERFAGRPTIEPLARLQLSVGVFERNRELATSTRPAYNADACADTKVTLDLPDDRRFGFLSRLSPAKR